MHFFVDKGIDLPSIIQDMGVDKFPLWLFSCTGTYITLMESFWMTIERVGDMSKKVNRVPLTFHLPNICQIGFCRLIESKLLLALEVALWLTLCHHT